jgi:hypothetical protein
LLIWRTLDGTWKPEWLGKTSEIIYKISGKRNLGYEEKKYKSWLDE